MTYSKRKRKYSLMGEEEEEEVDDDYIFKFMGNFICKSMERGFEDIV